MDKRIRELRKILGLTLAQFGASLNLTHGAVSQWEQGRNGVPESARRQICAVFNVSREWLETGRGQMFVAGKTHDDLDVEACERVALQIVGALPVEYRKKVVAIARKIVAADD